MNDQIYEEFTECIQVVDFWRKKMGGDFPTPEREHVLVFALEEVGEVTRAYMRSFPLYARNREEKHTNVQDEWADVLLMLSTFFLSLEVRPEEMEDFVVTAFTPEPLETIDLVTGCFTAICSMLESIRQKNSNPTMHYARVVTDLICLIQFNLVKWEKLLDNKLAELEAKHGNNA